MHLSRPTFRAAIGCSAALLSAAASVQAQAASNEFWQAQSIYQVITDRFFDGDSSNNNAEGNYAPARRTGVHGGDFKGLEQKLDYIKALGATAIWISPIVQNAKGEFHGYAGLDFYKVAPHWGSLADLQHLIQTAHAKGLLVIDDIVVNHGGDLIYSPEAGYDQFRAPPAGYSLQYRNPARTYPPPFDLNATNSALTLLFHNHGGIHNFNRDDQVRLGELSGLDDFNTESEYVRARMAEIYEYWIAQAGFDGYRVDTVKHVDQGFWQSWCPQIHRYAAAIGKPNFFLFGEVYDGSETKCGSYTGTQAGGPFELDSVLDYPLYFAAKSVFASASGNTKQIEDHYAAVAAHYAPSAQMRLVTFLDNHDQPRFLSPGQANNHTDRLQVALVFLYTARGIPCLYYGTEQAFNGNTDPFDREDMFAGQFEQGPSLGDNFNMTHPLFLLTARLNNLRRLYASLRVGAHVNLYSEPSGPGLLAYARRLGAEEVIVALNTAAAARTMPARPTAYPAGTALVNLLDTAETITVGAGSTLPAIEVAGTSAKVFIALSLCRPLDPVVADNSPAHWSAGVAAASPIVLRFSQPMDTNSVQAAFSISPAATGQFSWSADAQTLTFSPEGAGLAGQTNFTVRVADSAMAAGAGRKLSAAYELRFQTASAQAARH